MNLPDVPASPWAALGLSPALLQAVAARAYVAPTPVQAAAIPPALQGRDLMACAPTGSGKTAAFGLPLLHRLDSQRRPAWRRTYALVLVPTRELAQQVGETLRELGRNIADPVKVAVVFGGVSINPQMMGLRGGAELVVATPGRLLDLIEHNAVRLDDVAQLVLDEADRLLDQGFAGELDRLRALLPPQCQNLFFSATFPPAVVALAATLLHEPLQIDLPAAAEGPAGRVVQRAVIVDAAQRTPLLRHLILQQGWRQVLVFVATRYACEHVADKLRRAGIEAAALHGELSQGARTRLLATFQSAALRVLVATDVAARGLHIPGLPVVINHDLPRSPSDYTHRIGRTARAGAEGLALSFVPAAAEAHFRLIEKRQGERVPREQVAGFEPRDAAPPPPLAGGGVKGRRKSRKDKAREAASLSGTGSQG